MPKFSANISMLFADCPPLERISAARKAGFRAVEIQFPYDLPPEDWRTAMRHARLRFALINVPAGDLIAGGLGLACVPGREAAFRDAVAEAARYAEALRPACVNVLAGVAPDGVAHERCMEVLAGSLRHAAAVMAEIGVRVVVEFISRRARPGFLLGSSADALAAIDRAGHANLALQYDFFHAQIMEGDLAATLGRLIDRIGHIQFADVPGRHEPGTGEINVPFLFAELDRLGYTGWVGAEYEPNGTTEDSLAWFAPYRREQ